LLSAFEDETVIFHKVYDRYSKLLFDQVPLLAPGWVREDNGAVSVDVGKAD
jgi:DNA polymerase-3 subunit alpha/error-prone DNA polymerase